MVPALAATCELEATELFGFVEEAPPAAAAAVDDDEAEDDEDEEDEEDDWLAPLLLVVVARSKVVVESTANSVGDPTRSKFIDEALEAGPEQVELLVAVEEMEVNILLFC